VSYLQNFFSLKVYKAVWPITLGYIPLGLACGIFAQKAGLSFAASLGLCIIMYAGSGQFITIAMLSGGASLLSIGLTIFAVNLRHFLFSSLLRPHIRRSPFFRAFAAYELTDESFAVNLTRFEEGDWSPEEMLNVNTLAHFSWTLSNILGYVGAGFIAVDADLAGYALTAMFIGLWSFYLTGCRMFIAGILGGLFSAGFSLIVGYKLHIVLAAVLASGILAAIELKGGKES
jgi:4-azaleucine resistance transporter AzlC